MVKESKLLVIKMDGYVQGEDYVQNCFLDFKL